MRTRSIAALSAAAGLVCLRMLSANAQGEPLRLLVSNGLKGSMEALHAQCEQQIGRRLAIEFGSTASVRKRIEMGEAFDATMITVQAIDDLIKQGVLAGPSRVNIGRSELGIGIRSGAPKADISTAAALKQALLKTGSVTYPQDGASRGDIERMFDRLGIAAEMKPKIILAPGSGPATESVAAGKAAMVLTLFSEILPVHGVEVLGPLPAEYKTDIRFAAAASATSKHADAVKALFDYLAGPKAEPVLKAKGIERR